jgi:hypothetical protein
VVETAQSCRRSTTALIGTGISEPSFLKTRCNVLSVPTAIWLWICLSDLIRSAHCCSMRRWTLNGYIALIRSTSLTRSYARREYVFDGFAFPLCTKSWRLGRVPRDAEKCRSYRTPRIRRQKNGEDWSVLIILVSNVSISSVQRFTERSRLGRCYGCARGRFSWQPLSCQPWQRQPPPPHRVTACSIMPAFMDFPGDAATIGNINLALYDLPQ